MSNETQIKAEHARRLLDDPLIKGFFEEFEKKLLKEWRESTWGDAVIRERVFVSMRILDTFKGELKKYLDNEKMEDFHKGLKDRVV